MRGGEEFLGQLIARRRRPVVFDRVARGRLTVRAEQQFGAVAGDAEAGAGHGEAVVLAVALGRRAMQDESVNGSEHNRGGFGGGHLADLGAGDLGVAGKAGARLGQVIGQHETGGHAVPGGVQDSPHRVRLASVGVGELTGDEGGVASSVSGQVARARCDVADAGGPRQGRIPGCQATGRDGGDPATPGGPMTASARRAG